MWPVDFEKCECSFHLNGHVPCRAFVPTDPSGNILSDNK